MLPNKFSLERDNRIRFLEELSLTALPALQTAYYDGWVLRFANGYTRRSNSVNPIYFSSGDVDSKIKYCEQVYTARKQPTIFKLTPTCFPADLDKALAMHFYKEEIGASVQLRDLASVEPAEDEGVSLALSLTDEWLVAYYRLITLPEQYMTTMRQILNSMIPQKCCAALSHENKIVAVGLGVLDKGYLGLFDIVTDADFRRQGFGRRLVSALLNWGKEQGAGQAYLQVRPDNDAGLRLYENLGFRESYQYWYRTKELPG